MDDPPGNVDGDPPTGWVRLQLEPVDVPLEADESLLLSTVQSAIPGAHGLYYKEGDQRKALRFDAYSGHIQRALPGWYSKPIYVTLAHGCRTHAFGQYESATKTFEKSVSAIQRMLATSDLSSCWGPGATSQQASKSLERKRVEEKEKAREKRVTRPTKSGFEAQAEEHLEEHSDGSVDSGRLDDFQKLQEENENLKQQLREIEISSSNIERDAEEKGKALGKAQLRIDELLKEIEHMKLHDYIDSSITESERAVYATLSSTPQKTALPDEEEFASWKRSKETAERELAEEREKITEVEKSKNELISKLEWSLGEHKQWLSDATSRVSQLEGEISGQAAEFERNRADLQASIDRLHENNCTLNHELQEVKNENERLNAELVKLKGQLTEAHPELGQQIEDLKGQIAAKDDELCAVHATIGDLRNELSTKDAQIGTLNQQKNDAEWSLGEHRQWLFDANNRIKGLEAELNELRSQREEMAIKIEHYHETAMKHEEIDNLRDQILEKESELQRLRPIEEAKNNEIGALRGENDWLKNELSAKDGHINDLNQLKNDAEWSLGEHRQWLSDANNRVNELSNTLNEKNTVIDSMQKEVERLQRLIAETSQQQGTPEDVQQLREKIIELENKLHEVEQSLSEAPRIDEINALYSKVEGMQNEINDKNNELGNIHKLKNDAEWSLGEHRQWLADANNRITELSDCLREREHCIESLQKENDELKTVKLSEGEGPSHEDVQQLRDRISDLERQISEAPKHDDINHLKEEVERLVSEVAEKTRIIDDLNHLKNDAEWSLGEHRHWLDEAKSRISGLEAELHSKNEALIAVQAQKDTSRDEDEMKDVIARFEVTIADLNEALRLANEEKIEREKEHEGINRMMQGLLDDLNEKNRQLDELNKLKNDAEWSLGEHRQWLSDANNKIGDLERAIQSRDVETDRILKESRETIADLQQKTSDLSNEVEQLKRDKDDLEKKLEAPIQQEFIQTAAAIPTEPCEDKSKEQLEVELHEKQELLDRMQKDANNKEEEIKNLHNIIGDVQRQLKDNSVQLERTIHLKNDTEWSLGEHKQWLSDANNRIGQLTAELNEKSRITDVLYHQIEELKKALEATGDSKKLLDEVKEKNRIIDELNKLKDDSEWSLGEHKQWLSDANNRVNGLENACKDKDAAIDALHREIEELRTITLETPHGALPAEGEHITKLHETIHDLEAKLDDANRCLAEAPKVDDLNALRGENDRLVLEINEKNRIIDDLNGQRNDAEWKLGEHRQWLADANNRAGRLENAVQEKDGIIDALRSENEQLKKERPQVEDLVAHEEVSKLHETIQNLEANLRDAEKAIADAPKADEINALRGENERLVNEVNEKNRIIDDLNKIRDEKEWSLGEHRQWLADANSRASDLEGTLKARDTTIESLRKEIDDLKKVSEEMQHLEVRLQEAQQHVSEPGKDEELNYLKAEVDRLNIELLDKNKVIDDLTQKKNDAEWKLGEHQQWLGDANDRIGDLENTLKEKGAVISDLCKQLDELKQLPETVKHLQSRLQVLEQETTAEPKDAELRSLRAEIDRINAEILDKNRIIDELNGQKNDAEWKLGEHKQWLADANGKVDWLKGENDRLCSEISEKNRIIDDLNKIKDEMAWNLGEYRQWLSDSKNKVGCLEQELNEKNNAIDTLRKEVEEMKTVKLEVPEVEDVATSHGVIHDLESRLQDAERALSEAPKIDDINALRADVDHHVNEINEKNRIIDELNKLKADADWSLGEHRQWLSDANNRVSGLENAVKEKEEEICALNKELDGLRTVRAETSADALNEEVNQLKETVQNLEKKLDDAEKALTHVPSVDEVNGLKAEIDRLANEVNEKNRMIDELNKIKADQEWSLGEHRQWLTDANNRADCLDNAVKEKDEIIEGLRKENDELRAICGQRRDEEYAACEQISQLQSTVNDLEQKLHDAEKVMAEAPKVDEVNGLRTEVDRLSNEISDRNRIINELNKIKADQEWSLGEHRQWLADANNRASGLECATKEKDAIIDALRKENDDLKTVKVEVHGEVADLKEVPQLRQAIEELGGKVQELERALADAPKVDEIDSMRTEVDRLVSEINEKNRIIDDLNKIKADQEWSLGEHRQWLADANNRASDLENTLKDKDGVIDGLRKENDELRSAQETLQLTDMKPQEVAVCSKREEEFDALKAEIDRLVNEINEKNRIIDDLNRIRDEKDWQLGEHRQWLSDASNRAESLENTIKDKDVFIESLRREIDELRTVKVETSEDALHDEIKKLNERVQNLEGQLHDKEAALAQAPNADEMSGIRTLNEQLSSEINEKNRIIDDLNKIKADQEWSLGEHRQWLSDANSRVDYLELTCKQKDSAIDTLNREIEELKTLQLEAPHGASPVEGDDIAKLREALQDLESKLHEAEHALSEAPKQEELCCMRGEVDRLGNEIHEKNRIIDDLNRIKAELEWSLGEHRQWLGDANNRANSLENALKEKESLIGGLYKELEEMKASKPEVEPEVQLAEAPKLQATVDSLERKLQEMERSLAEAPKSDTISDLNNEIARLVNEINEKNRIIDDLNRIRDEKEWQLGEHRQWLNDAKNKVNDFENAINEKNGIIDALHKEIDELKSVKPEVHEPAVPVDEINRLQSEIDRIIGEINEKNRIIDDLNRIRDEKEWQLGEHRQWLSDANNKSSDLEKALREKDGVIDDLRRKLEESGIAGELCHLRGEVDRLVNEINEKNRIIDDLNRIRDEKEWSLGEHRQWLNDANNRANGLENALREKDAAIDALRKENDDLRHVPQEEREHVRAETAPETQDLQHTVDDLRRQLDERSAQLDAASHQRNDFEWSLGEHKQWLGDANRRVGELSDELNEKNRIIDDLNRQIREMKQSMHETLTYDEAEELRERCEFLETELHEATFLLKEVENLADMRTLKKETDRLNAVITDKNRIIDELNKIKADQEWSLGEHRQWLTDANNRADWLERIVGEKDATIDALRKENDQLKVANEAANEAVAKAERKVEPEEFVERVEVTLAEAEKAPAEVPTGEDTGALKAEIDRLVNEINEKNGIIDELDKVKNDAEWGLGEHKQWLIDANNRVDGLENACKDKDAEIDALKKEISDLKIARPEVSEGREGELDDLRHALHDLEENLRQAQQTIADAPKPEELSNLRSEVDGLLRAIDEKNAIIDDVNRQRDEAKWCLGEHQQWLNDANNRAAAFENALREKDERIGDLQHELDDLRTAKLETPGDAVHTEVAQLNAKIQGLEEKLHESEKALDEAPKTDEINGLRSEIDRLVNEINEKNRIIDDLNRIRDEKEWQLGEHRQWLSDATNRANGLENACKDKDATINTLRRENEELKTLTLETPGAALPDESEEVVKLHDTIKDLQNRLLETEQTLAAAPKSDDISGLRSEVDRLVNEINEKNRIIDDLNRIKADQEWSLGEHRQWLSDANNRVNELENAVKDKDELIGSLRNEVDELREVKIETPKDAHEDEIGQLLKSIQELEGKLNDSQKALADAPKPDEISGLRAEVDRFVNEINEKNRIIDDLNRIRDEKEWQLGEHRQWLNDAKNKVNDFENAINEKNGIIDALHKEIDELKSVKPEVHEPAVPVDEINRLQAETDRLTGEINEKNRIIDDLNRIRDEKEWQLGEHRQWLSDANNKVNDFENAINEKNGIIDALRKEIDELKSVKPEVHEPAVPVDEINRLQAETDRLTGEINEKNRIIDDLNRIRDEKEWSLGEHRQWLSDAKTKANDLEKAVGEKDAIIEDLRKENDELLTFKLETSGSADVIKKLHEYVENLESQLRISRSEIEEAPKRKELDDLRAELGRLTNEIGEKNRIIDELNAIRDQKEWSLGEHRQWLADANNRASGLENAIKEKDTIIDALRRENEDLKNICQQPQEQEEKMHQLAMQTVEAAREQPIAVLQTEVDVLRAEVERLINEINDKNRIIDELNRIRDEKEWHLGEHRQWLSDANNRINALEGMLAEKDGAIESLRKEVDELKASKVAAPGDLDCQQLREKIEHLETKLRDAEHALNEAIKTDIVSTLESTVNGLKNELADKNTQIEHLSKERNDAEWHLGECKQWLADANKRNEELSNSLKEKEDAVKALRAAQNELKARIDELERKLKEVDVSAQSSIEAREGDEHSVLQLTIDSLHDELKQKEGEVERLRKEHNDAEWSLGEHRQWLTDARNRIAELEQEISKLRDSYESALKSARTEVYELHEKNIKLEETLKKTEITVVNLQKEKEATRRSLIPEQPSVEFKNREELEQEIIRLRERYVELSNLLKFTDELLAKLQAETPDTADIATLHRTIEVLNDRLNEKNAEIARINQRNNDAEWHLGEHRQWLGDANRRIGELEDEIKKLKAENEGVQQSLRARIQQLEESNNNLLGTVNERESELNALRRKSREDSERLAATISIREKRPSEGTAEVTRIEATVGGDLSALNRAIQDLRHELNYQKVIDTLTDQKKDTEKSLAEQAKLLNDAYKKINELEDLLSKSAEERDEALKDAIPESIELSRKETEIVRTLKEDETRVRVERTAPQEGAPSSEEISQILKELEELRNEMNIKNEELSKVSRLRDEAEWCLGEHRQWLSDANNRNSQMSGEIAEKQHIIDVLNGEKEQLRHEIDTLNDKIKELSASGHSDTPSEETRELETKLREKDDQLHRAIAEVVEKEEEITNLHHVIEDLRNEMSEKNRIIDELNKIKADLEWSLGEHRQWLSDANNRANWLEGELNNTKGDADAKQAQIDDLWRKIAEKDSEIADLHNKKVLFLL
uniref:TAR DNA-binding protein 43 N-terminal domain-containing protein n=1 Tax=Parascaris univalens TaxID=6257 RepID=A0A915C1P0_PARUN